MNVLKRAALTAALGTAALVGTQPADAVIGDCTSRHLGNVSAHTDCTLTGLGWCLYFYDPMAQPIPSNVVTQTAWFVGCAV